MWLFKQLHFMTNLLSKPQLLVFDSYLLQMYQFQQHLIQFLSSPLLLFLKIWLLALLKAMLVFKLSSLPAKSRLQLLYLHKFKPMIVQPLNTILWLNQPKENNKLSAFSTVHQTLPKPLPFQLYQLRLSQQSSLKLRSIIKTLLFQIKSIWLNKPTVKQQQPLTLSFSKTPPLHPNKSNQLLLLLPHKLPPFP